MTVIELSDEQAAALKQRAAAQGLSVQAYLGRLVHADQEAEDELEALALEGLDSGDPIEIGPGYWEAKHRQLDERLSKTVAR
jgi:plasmid stability protein